IVKQIQERMGEQLRFVFRNFPISTAHPHAEFAAEAAEAAAAQDRFWEMHDQLYEHQQRLRVDDLRSYAQAIALDLELFDKELEEHVHADRVHEDFLSGVRSGVNGTPTFFINGVRHDDAYEFETLLAALNGSIGVGGLTMEDREPQDANEDDGLEAEIMRADHAFASES